MRFDYTIINNGFKLMQRYILSKYLLYICVNEVFPFNYNDDYFRQLRT